MRLVRIAKARCALTATKRAEVLVPHTEIQTVRVDYDDPGHRKRVSGMCFNIDRLIRRESFPIWHAGRHDVRFRLVRNHQEVSVQDVLRAISRSDMRNPDVAETLAYLDAYRDGIVDGRNAYSLCGRLEGEREIAYVAFAAHELVFNYIEFGVHFLPGQLFLVVCEERR